MIRRALNDQRGFSLIELLVVVIVIAILAAIALPYFLGQRAKGQDATAKSHARSLMSELESCAVGTVGYDDPGCSPPTDTGLPMGAGQGQVQVIAAGTTATTFEVRGQSLSGNTFTIEKDATGVTRPCSIVGGTNRGGCVSGAW